MLETKKTPLLFPSAPSITPPPSLPLPFPTMDDGTQLIFPPPPPPSLQTNKPQLTPRPLSDFFKDYPSPTDGPHPAPEADESLHAFVLGDTQSANGHIQSPSDAVDAPECPAVSQWRADFAQRLELRVAHERNVKKERAERAGQTLRDMHARWETSKNESNVENQRREVEFLRERDGVISRMSKMGDAPSWDVVPELVDMSGKYKEGARDTSRMRQVLMRMKS